MVILSLLLQTWPASKELVLPDLGFRDLFIFIVFQSYVFTCRWYFAGTFLDLLCLDPLGILQNFFPILSKNTLLWLIYLGPTPRTSILRYHPLFLSRNICWRYLRSVNPETLSTFLVILCNIFMNLQAGSLFYFNFGNIYMQLQLCHFLLIS